MVGNGAGAGGRSGIVGLPAGADGIALVAMGEDSEDGEWQFTNSVSNPLRRGNRRPILTILTLASTVSEFAPSAPTPAKSGGKTLL